ncbi:uncharacterized protein BJ212DRAFT_1476799 [Suillus subaureus]|uniref:F-box domain-containing protein n=1 Tax=Suillus subaureus TaxID=48587 RepID=A0A9P7JIE9_9AGAM|nr:uncharacterized protein BJ212DRAFT_1476799 [Suillus subaureus]KAG1823949.1 hypothetical protein BJ212DRAFT_1476799 [Suillus subaureus]
MTVAIGFLSLPTELICHILFLLAPRDLCRCAMTCKTVQNAAQNSIYVQYKLELYAQGFTETRTLNSISVDRRMSSLRKLDLVVVVPLPAVCIVTGAEQTRHIFSVEFRLASSLLPHLDSVDASLTCQHSFEESGHYRVNLTQEPAICGDRIVILYCTSGIVGSNEFIQVIDWKRGHAKSYPLREDVAGFHLVDEQKFVVIDTQGVITLYTLQEHGSPQRRVMYRLQESVRAPFYLFHATPSFHGATACPDLEPGYVPSPESQIIVLETLTNACPVILVIDMVIFSGKALHSETPVEVPWSEWGPQFTCCFRHHPSHQISVFGSKMAYALPRYALPRPLPLDLTPKGLCTDTCFYVHILDFNQRVITRAENIRDPDLPTRSICKPSDHSHGPIISNCPYIAAICRIQFSPYGFARLFLENDRLTLTWLRDGTVHIQVISPAQMEVDSNLVH